MEWISVKDRLPDDEQEVLVIAHGWDGRLVYVGSHKRVEAQKSWLTGITNKSSEWSLWGWSYLKEPMVTHWMPLPEPPETLIKEGDYEKTKTKVWRIRRRFPNGRSFQKRTER